MTQLSSKLWMLLAFVVLVKPGAAPLVLPALFAGLHGRRYPPRVPTFNWPRNTAARIGLIFFLAGIGLEVLAWLGSYLISDPQPFLMHPQLGPDLFLAMGFYGGMALGWVTLLTWWEFSVRAAFVTVGVWGLLIEQQGRAVLALVEALSTTPCQALVLALQVFAVYGAIGGTAHLLASPVGAGRGNRRAWLRYPVAMATLTLGAYLGTGAVVLIANWLGGLPHPGPIRERPFW